MDAGCWLLGLMSPLGRALLGRHGVMLGAWVPWVLLTLDAGNLQLAASFSWHQVITTEPLQPQDFGWRTGLLHSAMVQPLQSGWLRCTADYVLKMLYGGWIGGDYEPTGQGPARALQCKVRMAWYRAPELPWVLKWLAG